MIHRLMNGLARYMALLGGLVLLALIVLTCASVLGRGINTFLHSDLGAGLLGGTAQTLLDTGVGPILGDFELVEAGVAFAIFAFIPFCQITNGHATVDIFTSKLGVGTNRFIQMVVEIVFAAVLILIAERLYDGMTSKMRYGETTFLLQFPIWWAYAVSLVAAVLAALVGVYMAVVRTAEFLTGRMIIAPAGGADH